MVLQIVGIKKYIVSMIIKTSSDPEAADKKKVFLGKLNMILVQVLLEHSSIYQQSPSVVFNSVYTKFFMHRS